MSFLAPVPGPMVRLSRLQEVMKSRNKLATAEVGRTSNSIVFPHLVCPSHRRCSSVSRTGRRAETQQEKDFT